MEEEQRQKEIKLENKKKENTKAEQEKVKYYDIIAPKNETLLRAIT